MCVCVLGTQIEALVLRVLGRATLTISVTSARSMRVAPHARNTWCMLLLTPRRALRYSWKLVVMSAGDRTAFERLQPALQNVWPCDTCVVVIVRQSTTVTPVDRHATVTVQIHAVHSFRCSCRLAVVVYIFVLGLQATKVLAAQRAGGRATACTQTLCVACRIVASSALPSPCMCQLTARYAGMHSCRWGATRAAGLDAIPLRKVATQSALLGQRLHTFARLSAPVVAVVQVAAICATGPMQIRAVLTTAGGQESLHGRPMRSS